MTEQPGTITTSNLTPAYDRSFPDPAKFNAVTSDLVLRLPERKTFLPALVLTVITVIPI